MKNLLNPMEEDDVIESIDILAQAADMASSDILIGTEEDHVKEPTETVQYSVNEQLKGLAVAKAVFDQFGKKNKEFRYIFLECQRSPRLEKVTSMRQSTIHDHFGCR